MEIDEFEATVLRRSLLKGLLGDTQRVANQLKEDLEKNSFLTMDYERFAKEFESKLKTVSRCQEIESHSNSG